MSSPTRQEHACARVRSTPRSRPCSTSSHSTSVEDDALGEELQVIWELEPGARVYEQRRCPTPDRLRPAARGSTPSSTPCAGAPRPSADVARAPGAVPQRHRDRGLPARPGRRAPSQMPRVNLLIADDVGLGKTIEAGLVVQELLLRHRARTVLIVCPPALQSSGATRCATSSAWSSGSSTASCCASCAARGLTPTRGRTSRG